MSTMSEIKNITRHLEAIKAKRKGYELVGVDAETAQLMLDGTPYGVQDMSIDDILDQLEI
ncbi:hypothetical protein D3C71_2150580 [compost metagenome]